TGLTRGRLDTTFHEPWRPHRRPRRELRHASLSEAPMSLVRRPIAFALALAGATLALGGRPPPLFAHGAPKPTPAPPTKPPPEPKPKNIVEVLTESKDPSFTSLLDALKAAGLTTTLSGTGPFTLFAPTDDAFKQLPEGKLAQWMKPENKTALKA